MFGDPFADEFDFTMDTDHANVRRWWLTNRTMKEMYPDLYYLAVAFHTPTATSAPSERLGSIGVRVCGKRGQSIETTSKRIFVRALKKILQSPSWDHVAAAFNVPA